MPDSTPRYNIPFDLLRGDTPNGAQMGQDIATAVEAALGVVDDRTVTLPAGDSITYSQVLTGSDVRCTQSQTTNLLTSNFTLTKTQAVGISGKARFEADATSGAQGAVGISITVDGTVGGTAPNGLAQAGPVYIPSPFPSYTLTNPATDRSYNENSTSVAELANVLGTLINDITTTGIDTLKALAIPTFWVVLNAGSHTVILQADRNPNGVINASADASITSRSSYHPTSLTITV